MHHWPFCTWWISSSTGAIYRQHLASFLSCFLMQFSDSKSHNQQNMFRFFLSRWAQYPLLLIFFGPNCRCAHFAVHCVILFFFFFFRHAIFPSINFLGRWYSYRTRYMESKFTVSSACPRRVVIRTPPSRIVTAWRRRKPAMCQPWRLPPERAMHCGLEQTRIET